jgi:hypothetical protein
MEMEMEMETEGLLAELGGVQSGGGCFILGITELKSMIASMRTRRVHAVLKGRLAETPAVVLLGPRQAGKTTLALAIAAERDALYLDLESEQDRAKLDEPELYLAGHLDKLVVLDEVHRGALPRAARDDRPGAPGGPA